MRKSLAATPSLFSFTLTAYGKIMPLTGHGDAVTSICASESVSIDNNPNFALFF